MKDNYTGLIKKYIQKYESSITDIYISKKMLYVEEIKDLMGTKIFDITINVKGRLVFIDPCNIANWSHECMYCFLFNDTIISVDGCNWPPTSEIEIEKIDVK